MELVLPGAYYYIQMQDGHIEVQGTVQELRQQGILEDLEVELVSEKPGLSLNDDDDGSNPDEKLDKPGVPETVPAVSIGPDRAWIQAQQDGDKHRKKPRKLIEEEARQTGSVRWVIYKTYLRAS